MKKELIVAAVITAVVVGGAAFYGGMKHGANNSIGMARGSGFTNGNAATGNMRGIPGARGGARGGGFVSGDIIALDDKSMTVELRSGMPGQDWAPTETQGSGSKIIFFSASTSVMKTTQGSVKDLLVGEQVSTTGTVNSDGSVTAQSIQIRRTPAPSSVGQ